MTLLASDLGATAGASLAAALAAHPRGLYAPTLIALAAPASTATAYLHRLGVPVTPRPIRGPFDVAGLVALRNAIAASGPEVVHLIGDAASRVSPLLPLPPRVVVSHARRGRGERVRQFHESAALPDDGATADLARFGIPPGGRVIVAAGNYGPDSGLREAVWAFDIVRYVAPDWFLLLLGDGPDRRKVEHFARSLAPTGCRVRFAGRVADAPAILRAADRAWLTARRGGVTFALEALAARTPLVALDGPGARLARVESAADPVALARLTAESIRGDSPTPPGYSSLVASAGPEAVASRAATLYTG